MSNNKVSETQAIYVNEMRQVQQSAEKWIEFLDFAAQAQISKVQNEFEFSTKLIIHAHNPNATDCRQFGEWKTQDGNHVNRLEKGIATLSRDRNGNQSLTYLFDTSQTALHKEPERVAIPEEKKENFKSALGNMIDRLSDNASFSAEQKKLFRETADYKLCKQYGLTTNENPERFSGIENLSVREIANIGVALNRCSQDFSSITERNDLNDYERTDNSKSGEDRTELYGRERRGMDLGQGVQGTRHEVPIRREAERMEQTQRGEHDLRTVGMGTSAEANGGNGQVRQHETEIHMENSAPDRSDNAERGTGDGYGEAEPSLRGDERTSSEPDRRNNGEEKTVGGVQGNDEIGQIHSDGAVTGELQSGSGGRNTSRDGLRNITNETAEPEKVSAVSVSDGFENAKRSKNGDIILGNTTFRYIPEKTYTKIDKDIAADVAKQLEKQGVKFSGVIKGDTATITVSKPQKEALDSIIADISAPDNGVNLSQSEFIEIASNILSADETVSNAHRHSDEENYRIEINNGIDRIFTEALTNNRDIGYSVSEMSQLWSEFQNDSSVKEHIQTIVAENVDITLTANEQLTEYIDSNIEYLLRPKLAFDERVAITDEFFNFEKAWHNVDKGIPDIAERYRNGDDIRADLAKHLIHGNGSAIENVAGIGNYVTFDFKTDESNVIISSGNVSKAVALEEVGEYYLRYLKDTFREIQLERVSYYPELKDEVDELLTRLDNNKPESINENAVKYAFGKIMEEHKYDFTNPTFMYLGHLQNFMIDNNIDDIVVGATSETIQKHYGNAPLTNEYFSPDYTFSKDLSEEYNKYFQEYISMETVADKEKAENTISGTRTPTVDDLAVGDIILYDGKRREVEQIDENRISLKDLDTPDFGGILLGTSDVYAYNGWQEDMNEKGFEILSKAETSEKSISFSSMDFEKKIPTEMRFKDNSLVEDNTALYWVTQEIFTEADLDKFQAALRDTDIEKAYVIPRDLSGYSFEDDMRNNAPFAVVTKDSISCKDYVDKIKFVYHEDVSKQKEFPEITRDMYQTENPDVFVINGKGSLAKIDISVNEELWERLAEKGLVRNEESVDRLIFNTDGNNWNRLVIPDKWGNMTNNIKIEDVLTRNELLTAKSVADLVIKPENSIEAVENNEKAELSNEIVWTPISETEDENGRATSYSTKYNDKFYWISENADGGYDIEADFGHSILSVGEEYSNFPARYLAEEAFEDYIEEMENSFASEKQALISVETFGEEHYFKINESSVDDILKTANTEKPLLEFMEMGEKISEEEYAEIQQSDSFTYSVEMNLDNDTARIYTVNDGKGGISEADRTDRNVTFDTVKISDYIGQAITANPQEIPNEQNVKNVSEEPIASDNLPETKFTALSEEAREFYDLYSLNIPIHPPENTPWGEVNSCHELNKGIFRVSTPSHGGIMIRSDIADKILSPEARKIGFREKGFHCYEEDCDACVPERELLDKGIMQVPDYYTDGAEKYNESINEELQEWHTDYWDKREQAIFNARPEEEQAAITGQMSLFGDIPDLEDFPDFTKEENISDSNDKSVEKSDLPIQEQSSAEVTVEKPTTYCYVLEHSQDNITLSTRYSEDISIDDVVSTYLPINFENSPNLQQASVFEGENEVFVPYNRNKREDLLSKSKSFDLDGTYYLFESGKLFDKAESISSAFDKISEVQRETAEKFAGSPVSLPEFSYIKGSEERIIDRSILQSREVADTIHKKEENPTLKTDYFRITDEHLGEGSKREKFQNNIEAIRTLQLIENEERPATPEEQETLSKYIGWGGLQEAFDENNSAWSKEYSELINLLSEEEYEAARSTVNDAFYTSPVITQAIYEGLSNIGFEGGEILEPSMGVGNFFGTMPDSIRENSNLAGIEIDSISGRIAQKLYPEANIAINGYEKIKLDKGSFDLAVGNVPFGNHGVNDKTKAYKGLLIHDYFFAKSLDSVRPGGIVAFVTSTGTLDKEDTKVRQMLAQKAELMGAVRLPNNAFQKNAGTQTATDIIFLKKREKPLNIGDMPMDKSCDWVHTKENADGLKINSYFADNPDMVLGKLSDNGRFGTVVCTPFEGADLKEQLHEAMKNIKGEYIPLEFQQELDERAEDKYLTATPDIENLTYTVVEDKLYYRVDDNLIPLKESEQHGIIADRRKAMCGLGETVRELLQAQVEDRPDKEIKSLQAELTVKYDKFVKKYGRINPIETPNSRNASGVSRKAPNSNVFKNDVRLPLLQSLEKMEDGQFVGKTEIFTERTIRPHKVAEHVETAHEALILSMSEKGRIDFDYMEQLTGFEKNKIINDLQGDIFPVPELSTEDNTVYQTSDEYLSGNIYKKIAQAEAKISENPEYEKNIAALTEVIPKPLKATEIDMQLGMTWIDTKIIQQFMYETFETPTRFKEYDSSIAQENPNAITVNYSGSGKGSWKIENARLDNSVKSTKNFGTKDLNAYELLEKILNAKSVAVTEVVKDPDTGNKKTVILEKETKAAEDKVKQINAAFKKWIFADPERRNELVKTYNEKFNCIRPREYDGSSLNFFGSNPEISLKPHQKNAVAHALFGGNTLFAHQVGAGKTFEMIATAMEGKRLGLHNKSMFVVPNHLTEQIGADFMKLYPNANILVAKSDDFSPQKRRQMCARIATGNFDAVIIGHSQLIKIPLSAKREEEFIRNQINEVVSALEAATETDSKSYTVKQLEATKKNLRDRLEKLTNGTVKDNAVTFEELGVDKLFVDEAHEFKNLYVSTKMENVSGLSTNADVQKTQDLYMKCQYLDEKTGSKGIVFSTGTPVTNALSEMFTTMKYLQSDLLKETGLDSFDAWAGNFTRKSTEAEISPSGSDWRMKTRLKFTNVPELVTMFKECADIKMADQLNLDVPECEKHIVSVEPTEAQKAVVESLAERAERISKGEVSRTEDNMLVVTGDGRKLGLDQRLYDLNLPDEPQTKLNACIQNVYDIWEKNSDKKSTQLVFCDLGVPQSKEDFKKNGERFDVYADIRSKLIEKGIPEKEIAFIHDAASETEKAKLFAKVRSGDVRVLIGSTQKMGAGTNVQNKLIALHDLDCPWRPADLTQRLGRMVRQGNENDKVDNFRYVTKGTFDAYLYQMVEKKQESIAQIFTSKAIARTCDDIDDMAVDFMQVKMAAVGDDRIRRQMELREDIRSLNMLKNTYLENKYEIEDNIKLLPEKIAKTEKIIEGIAKDTEAIKAYVPKRDIDGKEIFEMKIGNTLYTDKKEAAEAFMTAMTKAVIGNPKNPTDIAEYKGFKIAVSYDSFAKSYTGHIKGANRYPFDLGSSESGNLTRIDNAIASVPMRIERYCNELDRIKTELADSQKEVNQPFEHEAELAKKKQELERLTDEINADKVKGEIPPEQPESTVPSNQNAMSVSEQQEQSEKPKNLNIKWKQNDKELRIAYDSSADNKVTAYSDGKEVGHCSVDELVVSKISESEQKNYPAEITKCVKPLNLAFSSKMAMHIRDFAEKVKSAEKETPKRETALFSRDKIMGDEFKPISEKTSDKPPQQEH